MTGLGTRGDNPRMPDYLTAHVEKIGSKLAVVDDRPDGRVESWTFGELNSQANRLANALLALGIRPRDKIIWCGQNSLGIVRMIHAARKVGAIAVPLNYRLSPEEASYVVHNSDSVLVYVDAEFTDLFAKIQDQIPSVRNILVFDGEPATGMQRVEELLQQSGDAEPVIESEGQSGTMIYTSGTTGKPKGAVRTGAGDPAQTVGLLGLFGYQPDDVFLTTGPLYHSGPGGFMNIAHTLGHSVVLQRKFNAEDWLRLVDKYRVSSTFSAPTPIRLVCNLEPSVKQKYDRSSMRRMIANAAPWSFALKQAYLADFPDDSLFEVYGSTELGVNTVLLPEDQLRKPGSCGKPSPGVEIFLLDDDGNQVTEANVPGELFVRSKGVFSTYHRAKDKYDEDRKGEMHTVGDVAYFDDEGFYFICDRKKDMIISGGMNIYPAEIEAALENHDDILDVAVFAIPSEEWGELVHATVVARPGSNLDEAAVEAFSREHLASYKIPRSIAFTNEIPRTGSGKILKRVMREPYWEGHATRVG